MHCQLIYCIKSIFFCKYFRKNSEFYTFLDIISVIRKEGYPISRKGENIYKRKDGRWEGRYMKYRSPDGKGYFLTNSEQKILEPRTMQNHFKRAIEKSSIAPANFHSLRHTFATRCVELGFDVKSLSEILGHASVNITMNRYVHPSMELKKKNMQLLSSLLTVKKDIH